MNTRIPYRNALSFLLLALFSLVLTGCGAGGAGSEGGTDVVATLSWQPPTENTDDTPLEDLAGYRLYIGDSPENLKKADIDIPARDENNQPVTEFRITSGDVFQYSDQFQGGSGTVTVYFALTAYNSLRIESSLSEVVSKTF